MILALLLSSAAAVGALAVAGARVVLVRRRLVRRPSVFPCTVRVVRGFVAGVPRRAPGRSCHAEWAHDVLVLHRGPGRGTSDALGVRTAESRIEAAGTRAEERLGDGAVRLRLRLDDDSVVEVAAPAVAAELLAGPFLAVAAQGPPPEVSRHRGP